MRKFDSLPQHRTDNFRMSANRNVIRRSESCGSVTASRLAFTRTSWGLEGVKKLTDVHIQLLLRIRLSYTVQA
jgi:hypothetical protein